MKYPSFDHIIDALNAGKLFSFPGGVHPDDKKALSNTAIIEQPPLPQILTLPLRQHVGSEGMCSVNVGDYVYKGQPLCTTTTPYSVPIHAPTSGEVVAIAPHVVAHPSGLTEMCVSIKPDGKDTWGELTPLTNYQALEKDKIVEAICQAGISGMGGAGFPTHIKAASSKPIEFLVINGVECEPYITSDDRLMREHAWQIRQGLDVLSHLINPKAIVIAVEDNKPEAIEALNIACQDKDDYRVISVETKYPAGGEKQLIQVLTGREVPRNGLPADVGVLMFNVGTCYAVADAILNGKPLIERIVTVTGEAVKQPKNFRALLGTPVEHLLTAADYVAKKQSSPRVIMGGPMMGFALADATIPIIKTTNCLLVPGKKELAPEDAERPCIRCSACADACPASLLPQQIFWHAKAKEYDKAEEYDLFDCIECGACAYVCPSEIPLVHYYRKAKSEIRLERDERNKAEKAKQRFEARKERLEREKREREEKHRKAKEARLAANKNKANSTSTTASAQGESSTPTNAKDKVAAALARAKAKKAALQAEQNAPKANEESAEREKLAAAKANEADDKKAQVAAAIARAKAKKAAKAQQQTQPHSGLTSPAHDVDENAPNQGQPQVDGETSTPQDDKKARIAAAVARAKAKKAAQQGIAPSSGRETNENNTHTDGKADVQQEDKKARIAAAVARAKAKKAAQQEDTLEREPGSTPEAQTNDKNARVAAAIAKAKAKKQLAEEESAMETDDTSTQSHDEEATKKKARIAAAVAKAKAKKQQTTQDTSGSDSDAIHTSQPTSETENNSRNQAEEKKARIAAAIAKAKAKKAQAEREKES
ncbi:electron transport complex subunit RsxC [Alteromonas sp. 345S023]|uniref:Ion-translocating oxidoreductase complex subunit C n=1 Tax=Alteromonas profundi TaxID=2696062 RepID=A0A7X5LKK8_9ALTE|nr:electron transport complex subunit RsxC [Alteromonas profundi]NDV91092.1 electron transport complex subunit RsxC [Alteromonas profundi]